MRKLLNTLFVLTPESYLALEGENILILMEEKELGRFPLHTLEMILYFGYKGASPALMARPSTASPTIRPPAAAPPGISSWASSTTAGGAWSGPPGTIPSRWMSRPSRKPLPPWPASAGMYPCATAWKASGGWRAPPLPFTLGCWTS